MAKKHVTGLGYTVTFLGLVALATLSLLLSFLRWPSGDLVVSLAIAAAKALLVMAFFMHLAEQRFSNRIAMAVSVGFVAMLVALTATDVATRHTFQAKMKPAPVDRFYAR